MRSTPFCSRPRMAGAASAAITGGPRREKPLLPRRGEPAERPLPARGVGAPCTQRSDRVPPPPASGRRERSDGRRHRPVARGPVPGRTGAAEVTAISPTSAADERRLVFDPTNLTDGITLSADPMLLVRSTAYSISYDERSQGACGHRAAQPWKRCLAQAHAACSGSVRCASTQVCTVSP